MQHLFDLYGWEVNVYDTIQQGLINRTYSVQTTKGEFILQSINHNVFKNPKAIDANINAIAPGYFRTDNTFALQQDQVRNQAILARIPASRWGEPEDLAGAAVFLASSASNYVNGHVLAVDGGWLAR